MRRDRRPIFFRIPRDFAAVPAYPAVSSCWITWALLCSTTYDWSIKPHSPPPCGTYVYRVCGASGGLVAEESRIASFAEIEGKRLLILPLQYYAYNHSNITVAFVFYILRGM
jgi:hypothetical protein